MKYIVKIDNDSWLCDHVLGDPGRTFVRMNATEYESYEEAKEAVKRAENASPLKERNYEIIKEAAAFEKLHTVGNIVFYLDENGVKRMATKERFKEILKEQKQ